MTEEDRKRIVEVERILAGDPACTVAKAIAEFISDLEKSQGAYLSYNQLAKVAEIDPFDERLGKSLAILTSEKVRLLNLFYVYENANGDEYRLSSTDLREAMQYGYLVDPYSGTTDAQFKKHLFPYFERAF